LKISEIYSSVRDLNENFSNTGRWDYQGSIPDVPKSGDPGYYVPKKLAYVNGDGALLNESVDLKTYITNTAQAKAKAETGETSGDAYDKAYNEVRTALIKVVREKLGLGAGTDIPGFNVDWSKDKKQIYASLINKEIRRQNQAAAKGWTDSGVFGELNNLKNNARAHAQNSKSHLKTGTVCPNPKWAGFTYEQIIQMEADGVNIPTDVVDWAHSCDNSDTTAYELAEAEASGEEAQQKELLPQEDSVANLRKKAVENVKACEEKDNTINKALEEFNPLANELTDIKSEVERTQHKSMARVQSMIREWERLDKKSKDGKELTEHEQKRFQELSQLFDGENAIDKEQMEKYEKDLKKLSKDMGNIDGLGRLNVDFGGETEIIGKNLVEKTSKYKGKYANVAAAVTIMSGPMAWIFQKDVRLGFKAIKEGQDAGSLGEDVQVEMNKTASTLNIEDELASSREAAKEDKEDAVVKEEDQESEVKVDNAMEEVANSAGGTDTKKSSPASGAPEALPSTSNTASNSDADTAKVENSLDRVVTIMNSDSEGQQAGSSDNPKKDDAVDKVKSDADAVRSGEQDSKSAEKTTGDVQGKTNETDQLGKKAKNNAKDMKKSDKEVKDEVKQAKADLAQTEAEIEEVAADTEEAMEEMEQIVAESEALMAEQEAEKSSGGGSEAGGGATPETPGSAGAPTTAAFSAGGNVPVSSVATAGGSDADGKADEFAKRSATLQARHQDVSTRINTNIGRIDVLQNTAQQRSIKVMNKIKVEQKHAQKLQQENEKDKKTIETINKALTIAGYVMTGVKLTGTVVMAIGCGQVTTANAMITAGTALTGSVYPATVAAGVAMITAGTILETTGTSTIGVGNIIKMVGTYGGIACNVGKAVVAATQGDLLGCVMSVASAVMSCVGGLPTAASAGEAAKAAAQAGTELGNAAAQQAAEAAAKVAAQEVAQEATKEVASAATEEAAAAAAKAAAEQAIKEGAKTGLKAAASSLLTTDSLMTIGGAALGVGSQMLAKKPQQPQQEAAAGQSFGNYTMSQQARATVRKDKTSRGEIRSSGARNSGGQNSGGSNHGRR
jgi:hypothetical protein